MVGGWDGPGPRQLEGEAGHGGTGVGGGVGGHLSVLLEVVVIQHSRGLGERGQVLQVVITNTLRTGNYKWSMVIREREK